MSARLRLKLRWDGAYGAVKCAVLIGLLAGGLLATATAATASSPRSGWGARDIQIAHEYWGITHAPDCATEAFIFGVEVPEALAEATVPEAPGIECEMRISAELGVARQCGVVVHEFGHWLGLGHSPDPRNVMFREQLAINVPGRCWKLYLLAHPGSTMEDAHEAFEDEIFLGSL